MNKKAFQNDIACRRIFQHLVKVVAASYGELKMRASLVCWSVVCFKFQTAFCVTYFMALFILHINYNLR